VFGEAISGAVPNINPKRKIGLRLHGRNPTRLALARRCLYGMLLRVRPRPNGFIKPREAEEDWGREKW
jgi:hypothetical protein